MVDHRFISLTFEGKEAVGQRTAIGLHFLGRKCQAFVMSISLAKGMLEVLRLAMWIQSLNRESVCDLPTFPFSFSSQLITLWKEMAHESLDSWVVGCLLATFSFPFLGRQEVTNKSLAETFSFLLFLRQTFIESPNIVFSNALMASLSSSQGVVNVWTQLPRNLFFWFRPKTGMRFQNESRIAWSLGSWRNLQTLEQTLDRERKIIHGKSLGSKS